LYTGQQYDSLTGDYYLRARYYDPGMGRFSSRDTWAYDYRNPVELNRYGYTGGNPVNRSDPSGHFFAEIGNLIKSSVENGSALGGAIGGFAFGIGGAGVIYMVSLLGSCGSEMQRWARRVNYNELIAYSAIAGATLGGLFGGLNDDPAGQLAVASSDAVISHAVANLAIGGGAPFGPCDSLALLVSDAAWGATAYSFFDSLPGGGGGAAPAYVGMTNGGQVNRAWVSGTLTNTRSRLGGTASTLAGSLLGGKNGILIGMALASLRDLDDDDNDLGGSGDSGSYGGGSGDGDGPPWWIPGGGDGIPGYPGGGTGGFGGTGGPNDMVTLYRATDFGLEEMIYRETGYVGSDAVKQGVIENPGTPLQKVLEWSSKFHEYMIQEFGSEVSYAREHSYQPDNLNTRIKNLRKTLNQEEYPIAYRTFISFSEDKNVALRFGSKYVFKVTISREALRQIAVPGSPGEREWLFRHAVQASLEE
jgi:RHS repeat-associated protein